MIQIFQPLIGSVVPLSLAYHGLELRPKRDYHKFYPAGYGVSKEGQCIFTLHRRPLGANHIVSKGCSVRLIYENPVTLAPFQLCGAPRKAR